MHAYFYLRGIKHNVDRFIQDLQSQYFPYTTTDPKGKEVNHMVQLAVRPIQLYEIGFPEPCLQDVMKMIWDTPIPKFSIGQESILTTTRRILGASKLPKQDLTVPQRLIFKQDLGIYPIGIKKDKYGKQEDNPNAHYQEFL